VASVSDILKKPKAKAKDDKDDKKTPAKGNALLNFIAAKKKAGGDEEDEED
jgi:hypothetical protein